MMRGFKKVIAWTCALTMVISSMTIQNLNTAKADIYSETTTGWTHWMNSGQAIVADGNNGYTASGVNIGTTWWHIQTWLPDVNFTKGYTYACSFTLTSSAPKTFRIDENASGDPVIFTETSTEGWVDNGDGTYTYNYTGTTSEMVATTQKDVRISFGYFDDGSEQDGVTSNSTIDMTLSDFVITREATGETEADPTTAGADSSGYVTLADNNNTLVGEWTLYAGAWGGGSMAYKGSTDDLALKVLSSNNNPGGWGLQAKRAASIYSGLTVGTEYTMTLQYTSTAAGTMFVKQEGLNDGGTFATIAGVNTYTSTFTYAAGLGAIVLELSGIPANTEITDISFSFEETSAEETTVEETSATEETTVEETSAADIEWIAISEGYYYSSDSGASIVNIQQPGFAAERGIYMTVPAGISSVTINGAASDLCAIQGAGVVIYLSALTAEVSDIAITHGTGTATLKIKNENGGEVETTTPPAGGEEPTSPTYTWKAIDGGATGYSYYTDTKVGIVNVQQPGFAAEMGIYMTVNSGISSVTVNGAATDLCAIQGAGVVVYLSALAAEINEIAIVHANGTDTVQVKNENAPAGPKVDAGVQVSGWQIAAGTITVGSSTYDGGVRTVYTIADTVAGKSTAGATVGLVYGFAGKATEADMVVDSTSDYVINKDATASGLLSDGSYAMIMASNLGKANANAINQEYMVRAYVVIDGEYYYSEVETYSTYSVAQVLYDSAQMPSAAGHAYVYALLKKVTPDYVEVDYDLKNSIVGA